MKSALSAWSERTSYDPKGWSPDNPAWGQCAVTALAVQRRFGGRIMRGVSVDATHYWNVIAGVRIDLTACQFCEEVEFPIAKEVSRESLLSNEATRIRYEMLEASL